MSDNEVEAVKIVATAVVGVTALLTTTHETLLSALASFIGNLLKGLPKEFTALAGRVNVMFVLIIGVCAVIRVSSPGSEEQFILHAATLAASALLSLALVGAATRWLPPPKKRR